MVMTELGMGYDKGQGHDRKGSRFGLEREHYAVRVRESQAPADPVPYRAEGTR